jgi:transposase
VGRSGSVYKAWLNNQPEELIDGIDHAALDPFRGCANAIHDGLSDAVAVLDAFHVVRLGTQVVDEVRRRVQQTPWAAAAASTTRCIRSAGCSGTAWNISPSASRPRSAVASTPAPRLGKLILRGQCYQRPRIRPTGHPRAALAARRRRLLRR